MDYKPYSPEWHRKRYLKEALDKYFDDYVENEVIFGDMMDILSARMSAAVNEVNKVMDLKDKLKMLDDKKPWGGVVSFVFVVLATIGFIVLGYFKGNMHLLTTLKNAREFYS